MIVPLPLMILLTGLASLLLLERLIPRAAIEPKRGRRWFNHAALGVLGYGIGRLAGSAGLVGLAAFLQANNFGLLPALGLPIWAQLAAAIILLDFTLWGQHVLFHVVPWLWPLHRVHHSDAALDVTTAWRFHPGEIALSLGVKALAIAGLGVPPTAVAIFEVLLALSAAFNHAHIRLPNTLDRALSVLIVTPDMHRVHHAKDGGLDRKNYGFFLSVWDKLFRTHVRIAPKACDDLVLGNDVASQGLSLLDLLKQPFRRHQ